MHAWCRVNKKPPIFWQRLEADPLWNEFWRSEEVCERMETIRRMLLSGNDADPQTLGRLRGQLFVYEDIPRSVAKLAAQTPPEPLPFPAMESPPEPSKPSALPEKVQDLRRRIFGRII